MNLRLQKIVAWLMCLIFLIVLTFSGTGYVLCVGDAGHIEFKTTGRPCCGKTKEICEVNVSDDFHSEHSDCSNCSDVELVGQLWSKRIRKTDSNQLDLFASALTIDALFSLISTENGNSRITGFHLAYGQSPPSYSIATTVLRC